MRKFLILTLALLVLLPTNSSAYFVQMSESAGSTMEQRREERLQRRLAKREGEELMTIRLGRSVRQVASPRRLTWGQQVKVIEAVDGSILRVTTTAGDVVGVRILGAEAPLLINPAANVQCYAREARDILGSRTIQQLVTLEKDPNYRTDANGNWVRTVRLGTQDIGAWMIAGGYAFADTRHDYAKRSLYMTLEDEAREADRGLWSTDCDYKVHTDYRE
ncbi:hypothetical protein COU80_03845 [Candidatus Peregrinibacteria bacterium CG10_big_fil_rev_8_21_14_0_10_55_24]|nr:MAG: hypothetical protein COU80_03845 [Candidatus Peregrinibacteria bacterium CG10_big_fil_rev_8_21_14_0_10_55_24]